MAQPAPPHLLVVIPPRYNRTMAWIKIPAEHHPLFREALPRDGRISVIRMFGALAALCNGNLFGGLFARSIIVRLSPEHHAEALALDGTTPFDPMGKGSVSSNHTLLLPDDVMEDPAEMRRWLDRAFRYTLTLPRKVKKPAKAIAKPAKTIAKPAKAIAKRAAKKKPPAKPAPKAKAPSAKKAPRARPAATAAKRRRTRAR